MSDHTLSPHDWRRLADLWHEVGEVAPGDVESLATLLLTRLTELIGSREGYVVFGKSAPRPDPGQQHRDWQPHLMSTPLSDPRDIALVMEFMSQRDYEGDLHAEHLLETRGELRACSLRERVSLPDYFDSPGGWLWSTLDIGDRLTGVLPVADGLELLVGVDRPRSDRCFSEREALLIREALRGMVRPVRNVARAHGLLEARAPLSAREHEVLRHLLSGRSEKQIADDVGLTHGSTHQVVVRVYRKFGVQSRAELMALWIAGGSTSE